MEDRIEYDWSNEALMRNENLNLHANMRDNYFEYVPPMSQSEVVAELSKQINSVHSKHEEHKKMMEGVIAAKSVGGQEGSIEDKL
jgi:hypothetical protein